MFAHRRTSGVIWPRRLSGDATRHATHNSTPEVHMKVVRGAVASIGLGLVMALPQPIEAAEAVSCAEQYYLCINDAAQVDGFFARTWAEQKCNGSWYACVKEQAFGA